MEAMSIVRKYGKPNLLIKITCNPDWTEIRDNLFTGQPAADRLDLVARVFNLKLNALIDDLIKKRMLGHVIAYVYTIEFQKRGFPHAHICLILSDADKPKESEQVDKIVSAELPGRTSNPRLFSIVTKCMIHGRCGAFNRNATCMVDGICNKKFAKAFREQTNVNVSGYPSYRRGQSPLWKNKTGHPVDNRWVVPCNKWLTLKYNAHINVEVCRSLAVVSYLFKYTYKGYHCASVHVAQKSGT